MANLKEIRGRIASVKNTRKITSAMSRIASARLRKAQTGMERARDYGERMARVVGEVVGELDDPASAHELLQGSASPKHIAYIAVTADRGLCGGFNASVIRGIVNDAQDRRHHKDQKISVVLVGKKGDSAAKQLELNPVNRHPAPTVETAVELAKDVAAEAVALFEGTKDLPKADEVYLVFNYFKNVITQEMRMEQLLPFVPAEAGTAEIAKNRAPAVREFEPGLEELLNHILPVAVETAVQQAFFNSAAAEVAARRSAMDSATDNAGELIRELTLQFNRERQAAITKELMEIVGGAEALKG